MLRALWNPLEAVNNRHEKGEILLISLAKKLARNLPHSQMDDNEFEPGNRFYPLSEQNKSFHLTIPLLLLSSIPS